MYDRVGGEPFFAELVDRFYEGVAADPLLRPLYPEDLAEPRRHLALFLMQYWGGPRTYDDERGHPRLRMRHVPFSIGLAERDAWLRHMLGALEAATAAATGPSVGVATSAEIADYFRSTATQLMNTIRGVSS
ncbi:MAG: globin [Acidimicrobiales bacterium]